MKKKKELSTFEEDLVWMSYRYCIGRKTAAATEHAYYLMKYVKDRLPDERRKFMSIDVYRSMQHCFHPYFLCFETSCDIYKPLNYIIDYIIENGLDTDKIVTIEQNGKNKPVYFTKDKPSDLYGMESETYMHDLCDIIPWQRFAEVLGDDHKIVTTLFEGKTETWECIETYKEVYENNKITFKKIYMSINDNGSLTAGQYLAPEYIIKIENKTK